VEESVSSVRVPEHPDNENVSAPPEEIAAGRALLETKLGPGARPGVVDRRRLVDRLLASPRHRLVVISAPVGFGKSTLLASWAEQDSRPFAWLSLEPADDDPVALFSGIAQALSRVRPIDPGLFVDLASPGISVLGRVVPRLLASLQSNDDPAVLVLRNAHEIRSHESRDAVDLLVNHLPPGVQLAVSSRQSVWLATAGRRGRAELLELGPADLAFDESEAAELFAVAGAKVSREEVRLLTASAEGWAAGLYLDALALRTGRSRTTTVAQSVHPFVSDYVREEVLSHLTGPTRRFLQRTSVLDLLSGPVCDAVLGASGSTRRLASIAESNLFVTPVVGPLGWYRVHSLFRAVLLDELVRTEPELVAVLHRRAAAWWEASGSVDQAIRHACAAGEPDRAARVVGAEIVPAYYAGRLPAVESWLRELGDAAVERHPSVAVRAGWIAALTGHPVEATRWADAAACAPASDAELESGASFGSIRAMLEACLCRNGVAAMAADAELAVAQIPAWSSWRAVAVALLGVARAMEGDAAAADLLFTEAIEAAEATGGAVVAIRMLAHRALLASDRQDWARAADDVGRGEALIEQHGLGEYGAVALLFAAAARLHLHNRRTDDARAAVLHAMRLRPLVTWAMPWSAVPLRLELADAILALGDPAGARILLREITEILHHHPKLTAFDDRISTLRDHLDVARATPVSSSLTAAELRLLPYLQTHLTLAQIGERLYVSRNTVAAEVGSVYRKLEVNSRDEAVERARELGLLAALHP
jgi:LuxR family transcriptional regulator, maltose regulon positive regulatory protein